MFPPSDTRCFLRPSVCQVLSPDLGLPLGQFVFITLNELSVGLLWEMADQATLFGCTV